MLKFHTAETYDGQWLACICPIGEDHTEEEMEIEDGE
jgi:hypothetical protein